ncbi:MAG: hypothetical protein NTY12_04850 [Candidatus Falkowbacteria bacterium]|nr:hypothetical protein [Candidatus Falkowbacteria bacterium]
MKNLILLVMMVIVFNYISGCGAGDRGMLGQAKLNAKGEVVSGDDFYVDEWYHFRVIKATVNNFELNNKGESSNTTINEGEKTKLQDSRGWLLGYVVNKTTWDQSVTIWNEDNICVASYYLQGKEIAAQYLMPTEEGEYYRAYWNGKSPLKGDSPDWTFEVNVFKDVNMTMKTNSGTKQNRCLWYLY